MSVYDCRNKCVFSFRQNTVSDKTDRAGSRFLRALRHESGYGPLVHIFAIFTLFYFYFTVTFFALKCCLKQLFLHNLLQNNASWNALYVQRGLLHFNINIVYSKVLQALEISGLKVVIVCNFVVPGGPGPYRDPGPGASASPASWMIRP